MQHESAEKKRDATSHKLLLPIIIVVEDSNARQNVH